MIVFIKIIIRNYVQVEAPSDHLEENEASSQIIIIIIIIIIIVVAIIKIIIIIIIIIISQCKPAENNLLSSSTVLTPFYTDRSLNVHKVQVYIVQSVLIAHLRASAGFSLP